MLGTDVTLRGPRAEENDRLLTPGALGLVGGLARTFRKRFDEVLAARSARRDTWRSGDRLGFLDETAAIRRGEWTVAPLPADLSRRVVELSARPEREAITNGLRSDADVLVVDFEDATSPTWSNIVDGHRALRDVIAESPTPDAARPVVVVQPRGLHLLERSAVYNGEPVPAALFDVGLHLFHNAAALIAGGSGPYFSLPKLESREEARLWADVFTVAERALGLAAGTIRATVLIETVPAAFEMDEILYELRAHAVGLRSGREDYVFSFLKVHRWDPDVLLPDRDAVTAEQPFVRAVSELLVRTCHRRGALAIGATAWQLPIRGNPAAQRAALAALRADKEHEAKSGFDGSAVMHEAQVPVVRRVFEARLGGRDNQLDVRREDVCVSASDLLRAPHGPRTERGLRDNVRIGLLYLEAWLSGEGHLSHEHRIADAAAAEVSRVQIWQLYRHGGRFDDGRVVTREFIADVIDDEATAIKSTVGEPTYRRRRYRDAKILFTKLCLSSELEEFLTTFAYDRL